MAILKMIAIDKVTLMINCRSLILKVTPICLLLQEMYNAWKMNFFSITWEANHGNAQIEDEKSSVS